VKLFRTDGQMELFTINVQRGFCPANIVCGDTDILDIDVYSCECKPLQATMGELFDSRSMTTRQVRLPLGEKFTIREWAMTDGGFEWSNLLATDLDCVIEVE